MFQHLWLVMYWGVDDEISYQGALHFSTAPWKLFNPVLFSRRVGFVGTAAHMSLQILDLGATSKRA